MAEFDLEKIKRKAKVANRYALQLERLHNEGMATACIEQAVDDTVANLPKARQASLVVYGEPQSGKTEMMICLTAKLLDDGHKVLVHLLTDSVDLLSQSLTRFKSSSLAPSPKTAAEVVQGSADLGTQETIVFSKKNAKDLEKLATRLKGIGGVVVVDDEADYASPNSKINQQQKTKINELVESIIGADGYYIGVTATPARLNLNATFNNDADFWVQFPPHDKYTGQETFFPLDTPPKYHLKRFTGSDIRTEAREALLRFIVRSAYLNRVVNDKEQNYTFLVHTSGKKQDHEADKAAVEAVVDVLRDTEHSDFGPLMKRVFEICGELYPGHDQYQIIDYIVQNASRVNVVVLNSARDKRAAGDSPTVPTSPFTVVVGGNIVSRGVTFPNLLSMYFTRDVASRLQQDTYIQRARMFGARGAYLEHFELTIPDALYRDWHKCFVFHKLALETVKSQLGSPIWLSDRRVSVAASASIDNARVSFNRGEMSFKLFNLTGPVRDFLATPHTGLKALRDLRALAGEDALPEFLIRYIERLSGGADDTVVLHGATSIEKQRSSGTDIELVERKRGFMGKSQLGGGRYPSARHHLRIFYNVAGRARVIYKYLGGVTFVQAA